MNITDCFDRVKTAVVASQSTLSKRSIARAPNSTRRHINVFQVVMSMNNLLRHVDDDCQLEQKIQQARSAARSAADAVVAGDPTLASEQMRICSLMVVEAESSYLLQGPVSVEIQSRSTKLDLDEQPSTVDTPEEPGAVSIESHTVGDEPTDDLAVECEVEPTHANKGDNQ